MGYGIRYGLTAAENLHSFYMFKSCYHHYAQILKGQHIYRLSPGRYEHIITKSLPCRVMILWSSIFICMTKYFFIQNHIAERHWVEINSRVNYPLKTALVWMQQHMIIDLDCPVTKYCVSLMTGILCEVGIRLHIRSWNNHRISGKNIS